MKLIAIVLVLCLVSYTFSYDTVNVGALCAQHSWDRNCCKCIVQKESGGNPNANNNGNWIGLFQISKMYWGSCSAGKAPYHPYANLRCAIQIYKEAGNSWRPWATSRACGCK